MPSIKIMAMKEVFSFACCLSFVLMNYGAVWADSPTNWSEINEICGISYANRIVGGTKAELGQLPWLAHLGMLRREKANKFAVDFECGGALIHPKFVVTAAHCAVGSFENGEALTVVKLGEHNLETEIDCEFGQCADPLQIIDIKTVFVPKEYDSDKMEHDIALLELKEAAKITHYVSPVCLPTKDMMHENLMNEIVEVAGWGWFDPDYPKNSPILQVVKLPVVNIEKCRQIKQLEQLIFSKGQICVGGVAGKDSCNGDSGGPLVKVMATKEHGPRYFLFGAVSIGVPSCGKFSLPAVYTNISHYLPWIHENIRN